MRSLGRKLLILSFKGIKILGSVSVFKVAPGQTIDLILLFQRIPLSKTKDLSLKVDISYAWFVFSPFPLSQNYFQNS